ncbi:M-phase phosphoprotein 8 [Phyllostomus discolor]|uniref:M-phase phosphoprotein 8 n=1 Tax=Phyllostomus discolor TaxID=89673 RepID=A0A834EKC0_9CHIR|nr:M-phase phosphoprotein 8 [Phyllostomus discolor]
MHLPIHRRAQGWVRKRGASYPLTWPGKKKRPKKMNPKKNTRKGMI